MRGSIYKLLALALFAILLGTLSCADNDLDDDDAADVIMEITNLTSPPVTARRQSGGGFCSDSGIECASNADCADTEVCDRSTQCTLEVTEWTATIFAAPKNELAGAPFNDIVMRDVTITYAWVNPGIVTPPLVAGLGNVTIPANAQAGVTFIPISSDAVNSNPAIEGATATLTMLFRGETVEGTDIRQTATRQLVVEICTQGG